jgi:hypothetical protein
VGVPAEIRTKHLPNKRLKRYHFIQLTLPMRCGENFLQKMYIPLITLSAAEYLVLVKYFSMLLVEDVLAGNTASPRTGPMIAVTL